MDDFAHLSVGVQLAGGVKFGAAAWLQAVIGNYSHRVICNPLTLEILAPGTCRAS